MFSNPRPFGELPFSHSPSPVELGRRPCMTSTVQTGSCCTIKKIEELNSLFELNSCTVGKEPKKPNSRLRI